MLNGTSLRCDIKYVTLIGNDGMQPRLKQIADLAGADFFELKAPISVLNTGNHKQLARASALTENIVDLASINDGLYVSVTISQSGLFNKSGRDEVHIRDAANGESKRVAKWGIKPEAFAAPAA